METRRLSSPHPIERSSTALTTLKMAVVAPMPSASAITAAAVKPGALSRPRSAKRRSLKSVSMDAPRKMRSGGGRTGLLDDAAVEEGDGAGGEPRVCRIVRHHDQRRAALVQLGEELHHRLP